MVSFCIFAYISSILCKPCFAGYLRDEPPERFRIPKYMEVRIGRVCCDRLHENRTHLPVIRQEPLPEVATLARSSNCSPGAAAEREVQKKNRVRSTKPDLDNIVGPQVTVHDPSLFRDQSLLNCCPVIAMCCHESGLPEDLVQLYHREPRDLAQAPRESRFA